MIENKRKTRAGFTLIEVTIVSVLLGILVMGAMTFFTTQKKNASINNQIVDVQQSSRLLGDLLEHDLRHAGLMVPEPAAFCAVDRLNAPDTVFVSDAGAINTTDERRHDLAGLVLEFSSPDPAYDTDANGSADSDFQVGAGAIVADAGNPERGTACGTVDAVSPGSNQITITIAGSALAATVSGSNSVDLVVIPAHIYEINGDNQLVRNGAAVADDIEDLQIAVFLDDDDDRIIDAGEYRGDGVGADFDPAAEDLSTARIIRTNLLIRTRLEDPENTGGRYQSSENRPAGTTSDGYRRRLYTSTVLLRNIGSRVPSS